MKMHAPITMEAKIRFTDGEREIVATYECPAGKVPTVEEVQDYILKTQEQVDAQMGEDEFYPMSRREFTEAVLYERSGQQLSAAGTPEEWDQ